MPRCLCLPLALLAAALLGLPGCANERTPLGEAPGVADDGGRLHPAAPPRTRIISLVPGMTETLVAIGAADVLVARTRYDEQEALASLPSVGGGLDPSLEFLADLNPDLLILWLDAGGAGSLSDRLEDLGIPAYQVDVEDVSDFRRHTRNLGVMVDREAAAEALVDQVDQGLSQVAEAVSSLSPASVLYLVQSSPPMGVGPGTFLDSLIVVAGGTNVLREAAGHWPLVSLEDALWRDPTYVVVPVVGLDTLTLGPDGVPEPLRWLTTDPGWSEVGAVREGRVIAVDAGLFGRPGPRMAEAASYLASRLHPGAFKGDPPPRQ